MVENKNRNTADINILSYSGFGCEVLHSSYAFSPTEPTSDSPRGFTVTPTVASALISDYKVQSEILSNPQLEWRLTQTD